MRTRGVALALVSVFVASVAAGCGGEGRTRRPDGVDVSRYPEEIQEAYAVFEYRCSRCHSLARPLQAPIDNVAFWKGYVDRMRRMPGSGINHRDAAVILRFLVYYTEQRTSSEGSHLRRQATRGPR